MEYYILIHFCYILLIVFIVIILFMTKNTLENKRKMNFKGAYLNYSSTCAPKNGFLNPSDLGYPQNIELRSDIERLEMKIKQLINAPVNSKVIINSGATESIANCVFWAKNYNKYGSIVGTKFDHSAVKDNCKTFDVEYSTDIKNIKENCSMVFLTHVDSKSGEIMNINNFVRNFNSISFLQNENPFSQSSNIAQYKPLLVLDATQSIMKVPINMEKWKLNAVFFSLHKIGGPIGYGVLVVDNVNETFKPLISGKQQHSMRGGTMALQNVIEYEHIFDEYDDFNTRKEKWEETFQKMKSAGLKIYEPKGEHLYNTFLISIKGCPLELINKLAIKGIYVGNVSACKNEELVDEIENENASESKLTGSSKDSSETNVESKDTKDTNDIFENAIRISFKNVSDITDSIVNTIINDCNEKVEK